MQTIEQLFDSFQTSAFRFEGLPTYRITETEELAVYQEYIDGGLYSRPADAGWIDSLKQWRRSGKTIQRVRMIPTAFSSYVEFELEWAYPFNLEAGEDIRVIPESVVNGIIPATPPDFWLFDRKHLAVFEYSPQGEWLGAKVSESGIQAQLTVANALLDASTDYQTYLAVKRTTGKFP